MIIICGTAKCYKLYYPANHKTLNSQDQCLIGLTGIWVEYISSMYPMHIEMTIELQNAETFQVGEITNCRDCAEL